MRQVDWLRVPACDSIVLTQIVDDDHFIVMLRVTRSICTDEEWDFLESVLADAMAQLWALDTMYHMVVDVSALSNVPIARAWNLHNIVKARHDCLERSLASTVIACDSPLVISLAEMIFRLVPPLRPVKFLRHGTDRVSSNRETIEFLRSNRRSEGSRHGA